MPDDIVDGDGHFEVFVGWTAIDASSRGYIGIVAPECNADMAFIGPNIVGGVDTDPIETWQPNFEPGVRSIGLRAILIATTVIEVATDITTRDTESAADGNHEVRDILADPLTMVENLVDGGIYGSGLR